MVVGDYSMPSMTTTEDVVVKKRLRIKYGTKKFEKECVTGEVKSAHMVPIIDDWGHSLAVKGKSGSFESEGYTVPSVGVKFEDSVKPNVLGSKKRGPSEMLEGHKEKRQKMDRILSQQCSNVLKKLMSHKSGWPFLVPVDPVELFIPDYFNVIKHPMDLGTIKSKLEKNKYTEVDEFAADVRLTFSNAMKYNPPGNFVHVMAKELSDLFNTMWKSVERKMGQNESKEKSMKLTIGFKRSDSSPKLSVKAPAQKGSIISNSILPCRQSEKLMRPMEVEGPKSREECPYPTKIARPISLKGTNSCDKKTVDFTLSKSPLRKDKYSDSQKAARKVVMSSTKPACQQSNSDPESDGAERTVGDDNTCHTSNLTTEASSEEECQIPAMEVPLSPKRALRAAMLKSRFAGTILKAQQNKLLDHGDKIDAHKIQQQKEILERKQREERIRLEAKIKAAEAAEREKAEAERRAQREREREAARIALRNMEKTVEFHETVRALKEIEMICCCPISVNSEGEASPEAGSNASDKVGSFGSYSNPLQQLGLFMKDDGLDDDEDDIENGEISMNVDGEEGEIIP
ncbi:unnamed protein product [Rhodiola kirilowii]